VAKLVGEERSSFFCRSVSDKEKESLSLRRQLSDNVEEVLEFVATELLSEDKTRRLFRRVLAAQNFTQKQLLPTLLELATPENEQLYGHLFSKALK
jgi:hypothetical protein